MNIRNFNLVPIGGWQYTVFETGERKECGSFDELVDAVIQHRISNNLPVGSKQEEANEIEQQICKRQPSNICAGGDFDPARITASSIHEAALVMAKSITEDSFADQQEADRRADLCARCFHSQPSTGCFGMCLDALKEAFHTLIGDRITKSEDKLKSCDICGCACKTIVWIKKDILNGNLTEKDKKSFKSVDFCWRSDN